jgi:hypothetical protein
MTSNKMFPLTLNLVKKKNTTQTVHKGKIVQLDTTFTIETTRSSNGENTACSSNQGDSARGIKKGENDVEMKETFQSKIWYDSWLWNFIIGHLNFEGMKLLHTKDMVKGYH